MDEHVHVYFITLIIIYICTYLQLCIDGFDCAEPPHSDSNCPCHEVRCDGTVWSLEYPAPCAKVFSAVTTPPPPPTGHVLQVGGGGGPPGRYMPRTMSGFLTHLLFDCIVYVVGFSQSSLKVPCCWLVKYSFIWIYSYSDG